MWPNPQETGDLLTFTEKTLNRKLRFFVQWTIHSPWKTLLNDFYRFITILFRSVFGTQLNIYDGVFLRKHLTAFIHSLFSQKSSIVDVLLSSKYASGVVFQSIWF